MPNWLASELCMVASFALGAWKTFKVLKHNGTDYNLLKTWCLLGLLRAFEEYFEFLVSWVPFYWLVKCLCLGLLYLPGGNIPTVVFERVVVWGMDNAHHVLNNLVVPNVVEFVVSLPWRVLMVLFPSLPAPSTPSSRGERGEGTAKKPGRGAGLLKRRGKGGGLSSRLQHLNTPTKPTKPSAKTTTPKADRDAALTERAGGSSPQPPPLPARPPQTNGDDIPAAAASKRSASSLVAQLLDADDAVHGPAAASLADGATGATRGMGDDARPDGEGNNGPESGGLVIGGERSSDDRRPRRRRSIGEMLRSAVMGSSEIRLRDHLFDLNTASPAPPMPSASSKKSGAAAQQEGRSRSPPLKPEPTTSDISTPVGASASTLATVADFDGYNNKRPGKKKVETTPPRLKPPTRRRPSEFSGRLTNGGGGGDKAGGGDSSDGSSRGGREGVRRRPVGVVAAGAGGRAGRRTLRENTASSSSSSSSSSGSSKAGATGAVSAARSARASGATGGVAKRVSVGGGSKAARSAGARGGEAGDESSGAIAIADSRAKRLAEWRKKRADRAEAEKAERKRVGGSDSGDGRGISGGVALVAGVDRQATSRGVGDGGEEKPVRCGRGGGTKVKNVTTTADASAVSPPVSTRRFRHVERFRSEMSRNGFGSSSQNPP